MEKDRPHHTLKDHIQTGLFFGAAFAFTSALTAGPEKSIVSGAIGFGLGIFYSLVS